LEEERVDGLLKKWEGQVRRNEDDFKRQAQELLEAEAFIISKILRTLQIKSKTSTRLMQM
jgi:hypothetical protein